MTTPDDSFEATALPFIDDVRRFALSLTRDESDADDLVQDTFLKAFRSWASYTPGTNCRGWLFTICRNTFNRQFRRERARPDIEREAGDEDALPTVIGHIRAERLGLGDLLDRVDVRPTLKKAMDDLPDVFREIVTLVDLEEFSYAEAAEVLEVPVGTVRSRLFRARRRMQSSLLQHAVDMGLAPAGTDVEARLDPAPAFPPDCEVVVRALWDLVDNELPEVDMQQMRAHMDDCQYCRAHEDFERQLAREIADLRTDPGDSRSLVDRVRARIVSARN
ncbi:MAG: sigma-70 family RNA polymerase sigma factor [Gemmatimonadota bacterium]